VLATTQLVTRGPDNLDDRVLGIEELARVANEIGDARLRAYAHEWVLSHGLEMGDIDAFEREFAALRRLGEARGDRYTRWLGTTLASRNALLEGRLEQCEALTHEALALAGGGRDEGPVEAFRGQILFLRREQGRLDEIIDDVESWAGEYFGMRLWDGPLCFTYVELGRGAQARPVLEALAHANFKDIARDALWSLTMAEVCECVSFLGDAPRAELLYELLLPYADRCVVTLAALCMGSVSRSLGLVATTMTRYEEATRHFEAALQMNAQIRSPLWVAHTQHDYAHMLLLRNRRGDGAKALELLDDALVAAEALGLKALADKTRPLKLAAEAAGRPLAAGRHSVS
jgi:tetratricopeptide (TPR) repeat protein